MFKFKPYLTFSGNCEEAIHFYERAFNTKADCIVRYSDERLFNLSVDLSTSLSGEQKNYIYHAEMKIGNDIFCFFDVIGMEVRDWNSRFFTVRFETRDEVERSIKILMEEAVKVIPFAQTMFSPYTGIITDKYQISWDIKTA